MRPSAQTAPGWSTMRISSSGSMCLGLGARKAGLASMPGCSPTAGRGGTSPARRCFSTPRTATCHAGCRFRAVEVHRELVEAHEGGFVESPRTTMFRNVSSGVTTRPTLLAFGADFYRRCLACLGEEGGLPDPTMIPSAGILAIRHVLEQMPESRLTLIGFTFRVARPSLGARGAPRPSPRKRGPADDTSGLIAAQPWAW